MPPHNPFIKTAAFIDVSNGFPVLLAKPGREDHRPDLVTPDATSGPAEWGRYHDAVREAARSFDNPDQGEVHNFLKARARDHEKVDVSAFHEAVRRQRMADVVDIVDHHMRRDGSLPRGARMVRTQAPRGYMKRVLRSMNAEDLSHVRHRLAAIGHSQENVDSYLSARANADMWDQATVTEVKFADSEFQGLVFDSGDFEAEWDTPLEDVMAMVETVAKNIPAPVINVYISPKSE